MEGVDTMEGAGIMDTGTAGDTIDGFWVIIPPGIPVWIDNR